MGFTLFKGSPWISLLIVGCIVNGQNIRSTNCVEGALQELKTFITDRLDDIDSRLRMMDGDNLSMRRQIDSIEASLPLAHERTSQGLIAIDKSVKEIAFVKGKVEHVGERIELIEFGINSLQNNSCQETTQALPTCPTTTCEPSSTTAAMTTDEETTPALPTCPTMTCEPSSTTAVMTTDCPVEDGYIYMKSTNQCFKFFNSKFMTFLQASLFCTKQEFGSQHLVLAHPIGDTTPIELRKTLVENYGQNDVRTEGWFNVRYDSRNFRWQDDNTILANDNSLWSQGRPEEVDKYGCGLLLAWERRMTAQPDRPYYNQHCSGWNYPLCELKLA